MKKLLTKIGGLPGSNGNQDESGKDDATAPSAPSVGAATHSRRSFSMRGLSWKAAPPSSPSPEGIARGAIDTRTTKNPIAILSPGRQRREDQQQQTPPLGSDNSCNTSPLRPSAAPLSPATKTPPRSSVPAAGSRRKRMSMSLSPSSIRAVLKSAGQRTGGVSELKRPARPGAMKSAVATADGGEGPVSVGSSPGSPREHRSPAARGRSRTPRRGLSVGRGLVPNFLHESSTRMNPAGAAKEAERETSTGMADGQTPSPAIARPDSGVKPQQQQGAGSAVATRSQSPPSAPPPTTLRRRVSMSLNPSNLKRAVGLGSRQDSTKKSDATNSSQDTPEYEEEFVGVSEHQGPPVRVHPRPRAVANAQRGSTSLNPTAARGTMPMAIAKANSTAARESGGKASGDKGTGSGGGSSRASSGQPALSTTETATAPKVVPFPASTTQQQQWARQRRSVRRSASFSLGACGVAASLRFPSTGSSSGSGEKTPAFGQENPLRSPQSESGARLNHNPSTEAAAGDGGASPPSGGDRSGRRHLRGRSMSLARLNRGSSLGLSPPSSPASLRGSRKGSRSPTSGIGVGAGAGNGGGGFRQLLRQKAAGVGVGVGVGSGGNGFDRRRSRSISPPRVGGNHSRTISMGSELLPLGPVGSWAGGGGGDAGVGGEHAASEGLPSILDVIPAWKRPRLLKGLQERETEYTTVEGVGVFIGTWNVNAKKPDFDDPLWLHEWLCPEERPEGKGRSGRDASSAPQPAAEAGNAESAGAETFASKEGDGMEDVYAIGFQELVDLNAVNVAVDIKSQKRSIEWEERVLSSLNLAALQQANKRRRRASEAPLAPRSPTTGGAQERDASDAAKKTAPPDTTTQLPPDFLSDDDDDVLEVASFASLEEIDNGMQQDVGVKVGLTLPPAAAAATADDTTNSPSTTERPRNHRDEPKSYGPTSLGDDGGVGDDGKTFVLVAKEHLVGTWLAVFVRASMLKQVSDVRSATVSAGMMGVMGNKGGVGVRLRLRDSSLCFVSSHLAAHRENIKARNENYQKILREMVFPPLPGAEWRRPQQQPQYQRRMNSFRGGGSSPPTSPGTRRRLSVTTRLMNPLGGGGGAATVGRGRASEPGEGSPNYRRKLSVAAPSLSGMLSPRYKPNSDSSSFASMSSKRAASSSCSPKRTVARVGDTDTSSGCLSVPTSPDYTMQRQARQRQRVQRGRAASFYRELSPLQFDGSRGRAARPRRRNSMCMSWSGASFTSVMPSSSSYSAASSCPPPPPAKQTPLMGQRELQPLPPALAITVTPASSTTAAGAGSTANAVTTGLAGEPLDRNVSDDDWPSASDDGSSSSDSTRGSPTAASVGAPASSANSAAAIEAFEMGRLTTAVAIDDLCGNSTTADGQTNRAVVGGHGLAGGAGGDGSTVASLLRMGDGKAETLLSGGPGRVTAIGAEGGFGDGDGSARARSNAGVGGGRQGGPTQVLFVPEITSHNTSEHLGIQDHDVVFWFGDLNYRIESSIAALEVLAHAVSGGVSFLAANDQLNSAREAGDAFMGFHEAPIDFLPTYKYAAGTDDYDTRNDKKFRAPAWCDRILFWTSGGDNGTGSTVPKDVKTATAGSVRQHAYRRSETPLTSDHKPVSASFRFGCKQVDSDIYSMVLLDVVKKVTGVAGDGRPQVDIVEGGNAIDFGDVQYGVPQTRSVWIVNPGTVPATFSVHSSQHPAPKSSNPDRPRSPHGSDKLHNLEAEEDRKESDTEDDNVNDDLFGLASSCSAKETGEGGGGGAAKGGGKQDGNSFGRETQPDEGEKEQPEGDGGTLSSASVGGGKARPTPAAVEDTGKWCSVSPEHGVLLSGERLEVKFTLLVQGLAGRALATGRISNILDDIHVLRVERGNDRYIAVSGNYEASVYGSTLQAMMAPKPTSATPNDAASNVAREGGLYEGRVGTGDDDGARRHEETAAGHSSGAVTVPLVDADAGEEGGAGTRMSSGQKIVRVPRQVWRMVDALLRDSHYDQPGVFVDKGDGQEVMGIRAAVHTGTEFPPHCANSMVEALVSLLGSLSSSVIPESACTAVSEAAGGIDAEERASALMGGMPTLHREVFEYLGSFFKFLLARRDKNGLTAEKIVSVQRSCLLPDAWRPARLRSALTPPFDGHQFQESMGSSGEGGDGGVRGQNPTSNRDDFQHESAKAEGGKHAEIGVPQDREGTSCGVSGVNGQDGDLDVLGSVLYYILMGER